MKKAILLLAVISLSLSCSSSDSNNSDATQLFRNIFNNTSWIDSDGVVYSFKTGKLFYWGDNTGTAYYTVGSYNNISYDGCVYNTVTNLIDSEDNDTFVIRQITSTGVGSFCPGTSVKFTFQVLNENTIEVQTNYDGTIDSYLINKTSNFSTQNAVDGTAIGYLW
jgi:hypothetical protein